MRNPMVKAMLTVCEGDTAPPSKQNGRPVARASQNSPASSAWSCLLPGGVSAMTERQKEAWSSVLLTVFIVGMLLGGLFLLRWTGN